MKTKILFVWIAIWAQSQARAQLDNRIFFDTIPAPNPKELHWHLDNLGFFRNTEYFGPIALGATQFGFQLLPRLRYQVSELTALELGGFLGKDFGNHEFSQIAPFFRLNYQNKGFEINFGNLKGSLQHKLLEPIFDYQRLITSRLENGLQFIYSRKKILADVWIDWRKMIYPNSNHQEEFHQGVVLDYALLQKPKNKVSVSFQSLALHRGGQIQDSSLNLPSFTALNTAMGLKWSQSKTGLEVQHLLYRKENLSGNALMANAGFRSRYVDLSLTYFLAYCYQSELGMPIYSSQSNYSNFFVAGRELLWLRLIKEFRLDESNMLSVRFIPYFDLGQNLFEYSYEFYWRMVLGGKISGWGTAK
jgi:hypothetical protein